MCPLKLSDKHIHPCINTHTVRTEVSVWLCSFVLHLCQLPVPPSTLGYVVFSRLAPFLPSPGEESRAWGWARPHACWLSLSITLSQPLLSSALLTAVILVVSNLRQTDKCMHVCVHGCSAHNQKRTKRAEVQTHFLFADAYSTKSYKKEKTHTHIQDIQILKKTDVALTHKTIQEPEQWLFFVVSDEKSAVQFSLFLSNERITPTFLINKLNQTLRLTHIARYGWNMYAKWQQHFHFGTCVGWSNRIWIS